MVGNRKGCPYTTPYPAAVIITQQRRKATGALVPPVVSRPWSVVCRPSSVVCRLSSVVCRPSSVVCRLSSVVCGLSSVVRRLWSVVCRPSSVVCRLSSVVCRPWSVVRRPWSVVRRLWSVVRGPPNKKAPIRGPGAERVGFEPTEPFGSRALQARALGQTTLPLRHQL